MPDEKVQIRDRLPMLQVWRRSMRSRCDIDQMLDCQLNCLAAGTASEDLTKDCCASEALISNEHQRHLR